MNDGEVLVRLLRVAGAAVLALALVTLALPAGAGVAPSTALLVLLIGTPIARIVVLGGSWLARGDRRFALAAAGLLAVIATGVLAALLQRR